MKLYIICPIVLVVGVLTASAQQKKNDAKLEALLDRAFEVEQTRNFKKRDKNRDSKLSYGEFATLFGEAGAKR